jgi:hypothetical protein
MGVELKTLVLARQVCYHLGQSTKPPEFLKAEIVLSGTSLAKQISKTFTFYSR